MSIQIRVRVAAIRDTNPPQDGVKEVVIGGPKPKTPDEVAACAGIKSFTTGLRIDNPELLSQFAVGQERYVTIGDAITKAAE